MKMQRFSTYFYGFKIRGSDYQKLLGVNFDKRLNSIKKQLEDLRKKANQNLLLLADHLIIQILMN